MTEAPREGVSIWSAAGGGPGRAGRWVGRSRIDPQPCRRLEARGALQASVVFDAADRVFVADMAGWLHGYANEGRLLWQCRLEGAISATPAVDVAGGRVFAGTQNGWVHAIAADAGRELWRRRLPTKTDARILSDVLFEPRSGVVMVSSWGGQFHALDPGTGESRRTWDAGLWPQSGASADGVGNLYFTRASRGQGVECVRVGTDGVETVLHRQAEGRRGAGRMVGQAAPVVDEEGAVVWFTLNGDRETTLYGCGLGGQKPPPTHEAPRTTMATPAMGREGSLVVAGMDGELRAFGAEGPSLFQYSTRAEYLLAAPVCDADGTTFLGDPLGRLHVVDRRGAGRVVFEAERSIQARPSFDRQGNLYLPSTDRTVSVFRNRAGSVSRS